MLKRLRVALAAIFFAAVTLLFLDFTGTIHAWLGWTARVQFLPAVLALNAGVIVFLVLLTVVFGRVYCSVICPMGIFQDIISWTNGKRGKKHRNRFTYSPAKSWLRYTVLALFIIALVAGIGSFVALLDPYGAYGRIAGNLFAPLWQLGNNLMAWISERLDSYAFYSTEIWIKSTATFAVAALTFIITGVLAWRNGRTYCNTICPVGTVLGFLSRFAMFRPVIDADKCRGCSLCSRGCKASCIDYKNHRIDYSRCVDCMDCIGTCRDGAISYRFAYGKNAAGPGVSGPAGSESHGTASSGIPGPAGPVTSGSAGKSPARTEDAVKQQAFAQKAQADGNAGRSASTSAGKPASAGKASASEHTTAREAQIKAQADGEDGRSASTSAGKPASGDAGKSASAGKASASEHTTAPEAQIKAQADGEAGKSASAGKAPASEHTTAPEAQIKAQADGGAGKPASGDAGTSRRTFIASAVMAATAATVKAQEMKLDGGLAQIQKKKVPVRATRIVPAGALGLSNFAKHCTACQLCVSVCPNQVLRPSTSLLTLMQPEMSYERGYCRPECTRCSDVCPAGAISPVTREEKSSIQIGHAVLVRENCVVETDGVQCGNCARHCPSGAITMVPRHDNPDHSGKGRRQQQRAGKGNGNGPDGERGHDGGHGNGHGPGNGQGPLRIPVVDTEKCIGCGACENLCPARPFSAIYVEGHQVHKMI